jgi:formylmethanofuran dehydrogenase subunit E
MGIAGLAALGLEAPITKLSGLVVVETDGCFVDGIEVATGATIGHRTLRVNDYGKVAATFVDAFLGYALRVSPKADARARACQYAPAAASRYEAQLEGYRYLPAGELLEFRFVTLTPPLETLLSRPELRRNCDSCGEEIFNGREIAAGNAILCQSCAAGGYYAVESRPVMSLQAERIGSK